MAKNPDERYLTPKEVAEALESFLQTWRPDQVTSQGQEPQVQEPSSGGNMSGAGGKKSRVGDAGWDWWLVLARIFLVTACIPVSLIFYEAWTFDVESSDLERVGYRIQPYLVAALCLLTAAGIAFVFRRPNSNSRRSNDGVRRPLRLKVSEALIVAAVFVAGSLATVLYYAKTNQVAYVHGSWARWWSFLTEDAICSDARDQSRYTTALGRASNLAR